MRHREGRDAPVVAPLPLPALAGSPELWYLSVIRGERRGPGPTLLRGLARAVAPLYGMGVTLNRRVYDWGWLAHRRLERPVISVGNLTLGGTGKTPCVDWLARRLQQAGQRVAILARGHGRAGREGWRVVSEGQGPTGTPREVGDEPYLLARKLPGAAVVIGKRREITGRWAIEEWGADVILLDDGMQYWRLARDRNIVLLDALHPWTDLRLFPAGTLREPPGHLRYGDEFWITRAESAPAEDVERLEQAVRERFPHRLVYRARQHPAALHPWPAGAARPPGWLQGRSLAAFCGIGQPLSFARTLVQLEPACLWTAYFPDHHPYSPAGLIAVAEAARSAGAELLVTTEKDAVRLPQVDLPLPLWVLELELRFQVEPPAGAA